MAEALPALLKITPENDSPHARCAITARAERGNLAGKNTAVLPVLFYRYSAFAYCQLQPLRNAHPLCVSV
jgi:hypothetical protein